MKFKYYCENCKRIIEGTHENNPPIPYKEMDEFECYKCGGKLVIVDRIVEYQVHNIKIGGT